MIFIFSALANLIGNVWRSDWPNARRFYLEWDLGNFYSCVMSYSIQVIAFTKLNYLFKAAAKVFVKDAQQDKLKLYA